MKKVIALLIVLSLLTFNIGFVSLSSAQGMVTEKIASESIAKEIAANAGGAYWEGAAAPALTGTEVALPVIDEATGNVIGHIVADQASLVSALNAAGYTQVAAALAAVEAGTTGGLTVGAGIATGTVGAAAAGVAAVVALVISTTGGEVTTTHHH